MTSDAANLICEHCGKMFLRREHRDRHLRRHSGVKSFQCGVCSKSFARRDTLMRHNSIHRHIDQTHSTPRRCIQACLSCARLKQRCLGGLPCARCQHTGTECTYKPGKATSVTIPRPPTNETPVTRNDAVVSRSDLPVQIPGDAISQTTGLHVINCQSPEATEQSALHHNTRSSTSNSQANLAYSPIATRHSTPVPTPFTPSSLHSNPTLYTSNQWDSSLSLHEDVVVNESTTEWDAMTSYFPFWFVSNGLGDVTDIPHDMGNHNQQYGVETYSHSSQHSMQGQAAPAPFVDSLNQTVSGHSLDPYPMYPTVNSYRSQGESPCRRFPQTQDNHMQTAETETFGHVPNVPIRAYEGLQTFFATQCQNSASSFIPIRLVQTFIDLYFEYFDPQFPFLHVSRFDDQDLPWILLLATAAIGSYYSEIEDIQDYTSVLCDLLGRAVESEAKVQIRRPSKPLIQSTFLRHVHLCYCGLHRERIRFYRQRSMLISMCYDMVLRRDVERTVQESSLTLHEEWASWLATEEETRLLCCTYMFQCIDFLFSDVPIDTSLFDISQRMPCPSRVWCTNNPQDWMSKQIELQAVQLQPGASRDALSPRVTHDRFLSMMSLLALYTNEKNIKRQHIASNFIMNSFGSHLRAMSPRIHKAAVGRPSIEIEDAVIKNQLLNESIDHIAFSKWEPERCHGLLPHILAILHSVPLRTLFAGTGWRTNTTEMMGFKMKFREFLERDGARSRKCLWHAAYISKSVQTSRYLTCYDMFSVGVAICYIILYIELWQVESQPLQTSADADFVPLSTERRHVVRLDQLSTREDVQNWVSSSGDADIYLTNVGILSGPDSLARLLRATEKALLRQVAWKAYSRAWARNMVQLIDGEKPTVHTDDYEEMKERKSRMGRRTK